MRSLTSLKRPTCEELSKKSQKWNHPFGVQVERFGARGLHPSLNKQVDNAVTPCDYNPSRPKCVMRPNRNNWQPWRIEDESLKFSKNLGYEHFDILNYRRFMAGQLGPGSHDINFALFAKEDKSMCPNQDFGREKRFKTHDIASPGPARYCVQPSKCLVKHEGPILSCSKRFAVQDTKCSVPCNLYNVKDFISMDALLRKKVSTRGPYDLFTGPRVSSNMYNKMSMGKRCSPDSFYSFQSDLDLFLHHKRNKNRGKFKQAERFLEKPIGDLARDLTTCYRDPYWPGPAHYVIADGIRRVPEQRHAFRISGHDVRPRLKWSIFPGPGRYNVKPVKCCATVKKRPTSVFASLTKRPEYKAPVYNDF